MQSVKKSKACWTCRSRKVRCDLVSPRCTNCVKSRTKCQYGLRLSWPREADTRRALVLPETTRRRSGSGKGSFSAHLLNIASSDILLHQLLSSAIPKKHSDWSAVSWAALHSASAPELIPKTMSWIPSEAGTFDNVLISYYHNVVSSMLMSGEDNRFRGLLIAMSFIDSSTSSVAVLQALYALTALLLYGSDRAKQYKAKAISALNDTFRYSISIKEGLQRIAAELLLSLYEIFDLSEFSYQWAAYSCRAKQTGKQVYALDQRYEGDTGIILEWLFYHDALSKFSARHWMQRTPCQEQCANDDQIRRKALLSPSTSKIMSSAGCSAELLDIIAQICDSVLDRNNPRRNSIEHVEMLNYLERRLNNAKQTIGPDEDSRTSLGTDPVAQTAELYRLTGLIYLYRGAKGVLRSNPAVKNALNAGLEIAARLDICDRAFPIVILGSEASTDDERLIILDLLRRTQERRKASNIIRAQRFIEASWAQDDLQAGKELDYVQKLNTIMSLSKDLPSFV